ncbi:MAG TPA: hypothetical protein VEK73_22060 [Xanthobacteraceae bacterium]|nr:hypothetical protein [Xanthobacteraceae bacterium]
MARKPTGRRPKEGETEKVKLTIPRPLHAYLLKLARESYAGADVGEIINHLLKLKIAELGAKLDVPERPPVNDDGAASPGNRGK